MITLTLILTFGLCLCFNPVYNNYTSLLNSSYAFFYYLWIFFIVISFFKKTVCFINNQKEKRFLIILGCLFIIGSYLPYQSPFIVTSYLHVFLPTICMMMYFIYLFYKISLFQKKEPIKAHLLFQWYFWGLSLISMLIVFFGHINGIIEIAILIYIIFMINKMHIICDS